MGRHVARRRMRGSSLTTLLVVAQTVVTACGDDPTTPTDSLPPKASVVIVSGDGQTAEVGTRLPDPLVVRVLDTLGAPAARVVVVFSSDRAGAADSSSTDNQGVASVYWTLGARAEVLQIVASVVLSASSPSGRATTSFSARATPGAPVAITMVGGHGALAAPEALVDTVAAAATDRFGNRTPGAPATWTVTAGGGRVQPFAAATDSAGIARALWRLGPTEGEQTLDVQVGSVVRQVSATASVALPATVVVAGASHSCALAKSGAAYCWGANSAGQMGNGRVDGVYGTPVRVAGGMVFTVSGPISWST